MAPDTTEPEHGATNEEPRSFNKRIRISVKLILGVAAASNICIFMLLYAVWHWDSRVSLTSNQLVDIQKELNLELRESVSILQDRLLKMPAALEIDPGKRVWQWLKKTYLVKNEYTLTGRDSYKHLFSRSQRRDIAKNRFIIQQNVNSLVISKGVMENSAYTDTVQQIEIASDDTEGDLVAVRYHIDKMIAQGMTAQSFHQVLEALKGDLAEELIEAERSRTRVLSRLELIEATEQTLKNARQQRKSTVMFISVFTILANMGMILFLTRVIIGKPLRSVAHSLKQIAMGQGDLTRKLTVMSKDELGELAFWFNSFTSMLKTIINQIQKQMKTLTLSARALSKVSEDLEKNAGHMHNQSQAASESIDSTTQKISQIAVSAEKTNQEVTHVAGLSREISDEMEQVGNSTGSVSTAVASIGTSIEEMHASLKEITRSTSRGASVTLEATKKADDASTASDALKTAAKEINQIVQLIKGIADQTQLLAFNAAIQAAGAGEAGKGFIVVANEIKELSRRTTEAAITIRRKIESMQSSTDGMTQSMMEIDETIRETHDIMSLIAAAVEEQTISVNEISVNVAQTSDFAESVSSMLLLSIQHEKELSEKLAAASAEAETIALEAKTAAAQTTQTRQTILEMDRTVMETTQDIRKIDKQIQSLVTMQQKLEQIAVQFKTE